MQWYWYHVKRAYGVEGEWKGWKHFFLETERDRSIRAEGRRLWSAIVMIGVPHILLIILMFTLIGADIIWKAIAGLF